MKINSMGFEHYQNYMQSVKGSEGQPAKAAEEIRLPVQDAPKTDKVEFSEKAAARAELARVAASISQEVEASADVHRLEELSRQVQQGTYFVETGRLADAILGVLE